VPEVRKDKIQYNWVKAFLAFLIQIIILLNCTWEQWCFTILLAKLTRSLSSSQPSPPAPITSILAVSSMNSRTYKRIKKWVMPCITIITYVPTNSYLKHDKISAKVLEQSKLHTVIITTQSLPTWGPGSKSWWARGPLLSSNFSTWLHLPDQSQPSVLFSTSILKHKYQYNVVKFWQ